NGLNVEQTVNGLEYDQLGRVTEQVTTRETGSEDRMGFVDASGRILEAVDLVQLADQSGKSIEALLSDGTIKTKKEAVGVDLIITVKRKDIVYDDCNS